MSRVASKPTWDSDIPQHPGRKLTEQEFVEWCTDSTWAEWVDGEVTMMAVNWEHADLQAFLLSVLRAFVDYHELGSVVAEPFQIRLPRQRRRRSPDMFFFSQERRILLKDNCFEGAPDFIIEIVSLESQSRDRREKYLEYQAAGVREYWIIDPLAEEIEVHKLGRDKKFTAIADRDGKVYSTVLPKFYLKPQWLWKSKLPKVTAILKELGIR